MERKDIINELQNRGYDARKTSTIKNGVTCEGILIMTKTSINPVFYTKGILDNAQNKGQSVEGVVQDIITKFEECKVPPVTIEQLLDKDFLMANMRIGLQRESTQDLIKKETEFDGIEQYLYLDGEGYSVKINVYQLEKANITIEEAWIAAELNTFAKTKITNMAAVIAVMMHQEYDKSMDVDMFIITNEKGTNGASAILDKNTLKKFGKTTGIKKVAILPSSIHEAILVPLCDDELSTDLEELSEMVQSVNSGEVDEQEQLSDKAYKIDLE